MHRRSSLLLLLIVAPLAAQQLPPVGSIDVYGLHHVSESAVRRAVGIAAGDLLPDSSATAILGRLRAIPGVRDASLFAVCCDRRGRAMLFIGVAEAHAPRLSFRAPPTGSVRLPAAILARDSVFALRLDRTAIIRQAEHMLRE